MIVKQIAALIKYNTLSSFRKRKEDWGIPQLNSKLLSAIIISLLCLYLVFLGCGSPDHYVTFHYRAFDCQYAREHPGCRSGGEKIRRHRREAA